MSRPYTYSLSLILAQTEKCKHSAVLLLNSQTDAGGDTDKVHEKITDHNSVTEILYSLVEFRFFNLSGMHWVPCFEFCGN